MRSVRLRRGIADGAAMRTALDDLGVAEGEDFVVSRPEDKDMNGLGPFARDSETSRDAALDNYPRSGTQRHQVLATIAATPEPTRDRIGLWLHLHGSSVRPRVWELIQGGFVQETSRTRRTQQGSEATVLELTPKGQDEIIHHEGIA